MFILLSSVTLTFLTLMLVSWFILISLFVNLCDEASCVIELLLTNFQFLCCFGGSSCLLLYYLFLFHI